MNQAHLHLLLNHFPIIATIIGAFVLLSGFILKSTATKRVGLSILICSSIVTIPAFLTGDGAEDVITNFPDVSKEMLAEHEELADAFFWLSNFTGIVALGALLTGLKERQSAKILALTTLVLSLVSVVLAQKVGAAGGAIRHNEIRPDAIMTGEEGWPDDKKPHK